MVVLAGQLFHGLLSKGGGGVMVRPGRLPKNTLSVRVVVLG